MTLSLGKTFFLAFYLAAKVDGGSKYLLVRIDSPTQNATQNRNLAGLRNLRFAPSPFSSGFMNVIYSHDEDDEAEPERTQLSRKRRSVGRSGEERHRRKRPCSRHSKRSTNRSLRSLRRHQPAETEDEPAYYGPEAREYDNYTYDEDENDLSSAEKDWSNYNETKKEVYDMLAGTLRNNYRSGKLKKDVKEWHCDLCKDSHSKPGKKPKRKKRKLKDKISKPEMHQGKTGKAGKKWSKTKPGDKFDAKEKPKKHAGKWPKGGKPPKSKPKKKSTKYSKGKLGKKSKKKPKLENFTENESSRGPNRKKKSKKYSKSKPRRKVGQKLEKWSVKKMPQHKKKHGKDCSCNKAKKEESKAKLKPRSTGQQKPADVPKRKIAKAKKAHGAPKKKHKENMSTEIKPSTAKWKWNSDKKKKKRPNLEKAFRTLPSVHEKFRPKRKSFRSQSDHDFLRMLMEKRKRNT